MRIVDVEALEKQIKDRPMLFYTHGADYPLISYEDVIELINDAPTIEAKPVVHAHWFMTEYEYFDCSNCGVAIWNGCDSTAQAKQMLANKEVMFKFCPYCGAQMDEKEGV